MALFARHVPHPAYVALPVDDQHPLGAETDARITEGLRPYRGSDRQQHAERDSDQGTTEHRFYLQTQRCQRPEHRR